jgi:3-isopropylmalate/(R)-2-methylmalate dehydratase small subunit
MTLILHGRCWKFGHNICIDGEIMARRFLNERIFDSAILSHHIFEEMDPDIAKQVRPGDIIIAGKRFAHGNPHVLGFLGIRGAGLGLLTESIPRGAFRNAVFAGVPIIPNCHNITSLINHLDEVEVNFESGQVNDLSTGREFKFNPLPEFCLEIIKAGGGIAHMKKKMGLLR